MTTINATSSLSSTAAYSGVSNSSRHHRANPEKMAEALFSKLDTSSKGYIEQNDLSTAFSALSTNGTSSTGNGASALFSQLDSDSDGKVTKDEWSSGIQKLAETLESQFADMRMQGAMPPPPPANDSGFTKDELNQQLSEIGSSDSKRSSLISTIVQNFSQADSDGDGKVSMKEAMAFDTAQKQSTTSTTAASSSNTTGASASSSSATSTDAVTSNAQLFRQLMALMRAYGGNSETGKATTTIATTA